MRKRRLKVSKAKFQTRNGDTLADLERRMGEIKPKLMAAREQLRQAEANLVPLRQTIFALEMAALNCHGRLTHWHDEYERQ